MRFSCDSCGAQYMISDEKVGPGGVKVRCKRCGHVVLVRQAAAAPPVVEPAAEAPAAPAPGGAAPGGESALDAELGMAFDNVFGGAPGAAPAATAEEERAPAPAEEAPAPSAPAPAPEAVEWYVAIGDRQVGPLLPAGVKGRWEAGEIGPDSLVWRAGMSDWAPLSGVSELAQLVAPLPRPAARTPARPAEPAAPAEPARTPEPAREPEPGWKPAAASALAKLASEEMASLATPEPPKTGPGSLVEKMQLPEGGVDPTGMIPLHLRGVDNTGETLLSEKRPRQESTEVRQLRKSTNRRLVWSVVGVTAVFGAAMAYVVTTVLPARTAAPVVAVAPPAPPAPAAQPPAPPAPPAATPTPAAPPTATPTATPAPAATPTAAPPPTPPPSPPAVAAEEPPRPPPKAARSAPAAKAKAKATRREPERKVAAASERPAPARKPAGDPLLDVAGDDDLSKDLAGAGKKRSVYVPPAPGSDVPERVGDPQIIEAIVGKKTALQACVEEQRATGADARGPLMLRWSILPDGSVKDVKSLSEGLSRQPIVPCISGVVKSIKFPRTRLGREVEAFPFKF